MKQSLKAQQFKLPLIEQKQSNSNKPSKSTTKRTQLSHNLSQIQYPQKQKNLPKLSKFIHPSDKMQRQFNKSHSLKKINKTNANAELQGQSDFEEKIKQNKMLLKKHKLQKELQKRTRSISKQINKQNINELDNLPEIHSKKAILPKRTNKKFISFLVNENSEDWVETIMKGTKVNRTKSNGQLPKIHLHNKLSGSDVFENIHLFLKGVKSQNQSKEKCVVAQDEIYRRILKYKSQLKKMEPNSEFLKSLQERIENKRSLAKKKDKCEKSRRENGLRYMTCSEWAKISLNRQDLKYLESTFEDEVEKINTYLGKTSECLEQLLKNRMSIIDLIVLGKLKIKKAKQ